MSIVVADHDENLCIEVKTILQKLDYTDLEYACSKDELLEKMQDVEPDLVLLGLQLDDADGIEVLKIITNDHKNSKVILMTQPGEFNRVMEGIMNGAKDFITLPPNSDRIDELVYKSLYGHGRNEKHNFW